MPKDTLAAVRTVRDINYYRIKKVASRGLRPGIKALFYNPQLGTVLMGTLPEGYPSRFNLPGGGIDKRQTAAKALCREIEEELDISTYLPDLVKPLPVVAHGELPFPRDDFWGKYEFIVAVPNLQLGSIRAQPDSKMLLWPVMPWQEALGKVKSLAYGGPEMVSLYSKALMAVPDLLYR